MSRHKKIGLWVIGILGTLLLLLLIFVLLLPTLINLEPIKEKILASISTKVGGEVRWEKVDLPWFPRPRVVIRQGSLSIPRKVSATVKSLALYPEIMPLLTGRVRLALLHMEAPEAKIKLPERPGEKKEKLSAFSFATGGEKVATILAHLALKAPAPVFIAERGRLTLLQEEGKAAFRFHDIHVRIGPSGNRLKVDLTCKSNLWENLSLEGWLNPQDFKASGRMALARFQPQSVTEYLFPGATVRVGDSRVDLDISFQLEGIKGFHAEVRGSLPSLTLYREHEKLVIKGKGLTGAVHVEGDGAMLSLSELHLDYPHLKMSGRFLINRASRVLSLKLEGREVDVHSLREVALALTQRSGIARKIFEIVRGGTVPLIAFHAEGSTVRDLGKAENMLIQGNMLKGNIFIPWGNLDLEEVKGNAVISNGILDGKNLEARLGNSRGRDGKLRLGLQGKGAPFHLDIMVKADLAQLPPLLGQLVKNEILAREIALIEDFKGSAQGRLVLRERGKSIKVWVDVSDLNLSGQYGRIPYPLEISRGQLSYGGSEIALNNMRGRLGNSSFSGLSTSIGWEKEPHVEINCEAARVSMDEIYPWLLSVERLSGILKKAESIKGTIVLNGLDLRGPLLRPREWLFQMAGNVENLAMDSTLFPGPVAVARGRFEAIPEKLSLWDFQITILDASLEVSGILPGYLEGLRKMDSTLQGNMGPQATRWASDAIRLPPELRVRAPLSISKAHLAWGKNGKTSFSGKLILQDGPRLSVDIVLDPEELVVRNVLIHDEESHASFGFALREREINLNFKGRLNKRTLDGVLERNQFLRGWIEGDIRAHMVIDRPMISTVQGKLQWVGLDYPWKLRIPVKIESVSLDARKNKLRVKSAFLTWGESRLALEGNMEFSPEGFLLDMDLSSDGFEWDRVKEIFEEGNGERDHERGEHVWPLPLQGTVRVKSGFFKYGRFTWSPFLAEISFGDGGIHVEVAEADLCGISTPGILRISPHDLMVNINPAGKNQDLDSTLACLLDKKRLVSGTFDLGGKLIARGKYGELAQSLQGDLECVAKNGRIYRFGLLAKLFALLNATEVFRGRLPDLGKEGFAYYSIRAKANLREGKLTLQEAIIDGSPMDIVCRGDVNLISKKTDLTVLVAPLKTADLIIRQIPLARDILGGTLIFIPLKVTGDIRDPSIIPLSPSAVGSELRGMVERALRLPSKIIQPLLPGRKE